MRILAQATYKGGRLDQTYYPPDTPITISISTWLFSSKVTIARTRGFHEEDMSDTRATYLRFADFLLEWDDINQIREDKWSTNPNE